MSFRRSILGALTGPESANKVRLLFGARQTGKTSLLRQVAAPETTLGYDLLDTRLRRRLEADPGALGRELRAAPPEMRTVVIDEVQKVPPLLDEIQAFYDRQPERMQFYLTGSSARRLRTHSANLLPGRSHVFHLHPVTQSEAGATSLAGWPTATAAPASSSSEAPAPLPHFPSRTLERRCCYGALPGVWQESDASAARTLSAYVENYLEEEIRREAHARDLGAFSVFLRLAALESGRALNLAGLSQESGIPASTLRTYCDLLVDTFIARWVGAYGHPGRKRVLTTPRFVFFDLGVRNAAAGLPLQLEALAPFHGDLFEQWVLLELLARASLAGRSHRVSFWRTRTGAEVDLVYETPDEDVPIEVKWTENPRPRDARHLETFIEAHPTRARRGLLVCRAERPQMLTDRVLALPWDML